MVICANPADASPRDGAKHGACLFDGKL